MLITGCTLTRVNDSFITLERIKNKEGSIAYSCISDILLSCFNVMLGYLWICSTPMSVYLRVLLLLLLSLPVRALSLHETAPAIEAMDINQHTSIKLQDYLGKVVLIDFWASWCVPCRRALPELNRLRNRFKDKNFEVLAINLDKNSQDAQRFLNRYPVQYPVLIDVPAAQLRAYQIEGLPVSYLIDKNGIIIKRFVGFKKSHLQQIALFLSAP